ncbi:hypothetical protein ACWF0M_05195 [Kribbella sp. NPDC055110]
MEDGFYGGYGSHRATARRVTPRPARRRDHPPHHRQAVTASNTPYALYDYQQAPGRPVPITFIPYYAWANRGRHAMRVWIPTA